MNDVFISYANKNSDIVSSLVENLEKNNFTVWYYERDSNPGPSYLSQIGKAVETCRAFIVIISPYSLLSNQVTNEIVLAHENRKKIIPILYDITHESWQENKIEWRGAIGAATSIPIIDEDVKSILPKLISGLKSLGIKTKKETKTVSKENSFTGMNRPIRIKGFTGRHKEIEQLEQALKNENISIIIIEGISGVGKTALSAHFALIIEVFDYKPFWLECREDTSIDSIVYKLATFAKFYGNEAISNVLDETTDFEDRLDRIASILTDLKYAIFLDDYHLIQDLKINRFLQKIDQFSGFTKVFLTSRIRPNLISLISPLSVFEKRLQTGIDLKSCIQFLNSCNLSTDKETAEKIWKLTGKGHPKALEIFITRSKNIPTKKLLSTLPVFQIELTQEWLTPLMEELPKDLKQIVIDLSIFDRPIPIEALNDLYPESNIEIILPKLVDRFILDLIDENNLSIHPLIREYCYALIENKHEKHKLAASYYVTSSEIDQFPEILSDTQTESLIAAWTHYLKAKEPQKSIEIINQIRSSLINKGHYEQLMFLLEHTHPDNDRDIEWFTINKARIFSIWGDSEHAIKILQPIIHSSEDTQICRESILVLSQIYCEKNEPETAISLLEDNSPLFFKNINNRTILRFLSRLVMAYRQVNELEKSLEWASRICNICQEKGDEIGGGKALRSMAIILKDKGEFETALNLCQNCCELFKKHSLLRELAISKQLLAELFYKLDDFKNAQQTILSAQQAFLKIGDRKNSNACEHLINNFERQV